MSKPARFAACTCSAAAKPVTAMSRISLPSTARICRATWYPSMPGMPISIRPTCGRHSRASATHEGPSGQTRVSCRSMPTRSDIVCRASSLSSQISTRTARLLARAAQEPNAREQRARGHGYAAREGARLLHRHAARLRRHELHASLHHARAELAEPLAEHRLGVVEEHRLLVCDVVD